MKIKAAISLMQDSGTDHPFFPPLDESQKLWMSVESNKKAILGGMRSTAEAEAILGLNAKEILGL
jgi:aminocarboxymuconate-semialdehyde decarboxylase